MRKPSFNEMLSHADLNASDKIILNLYVRMDDPSNDGQALEPELTSALRKLRSPNNPAVL